MRIAVLGIKGLPAKWGADRVVEEIVQRLALRHEITVYCSSREVPDGMKFPGVRLVRVPCLAGKFTHMVSVNLMAALHVLFRGDYELVHLHNIETAFILPLLRLRNNVISTAHGRITAGNKWGKFATYVMRLMEYPFTHWSIIATSVSEKDAQDISSKYHREVIHIPNGVDVTSVMDVASPQLLAGAGVAVKEYLIFVAGRIIPLKGAHLLLEAYNRLQGTNHLLLIGDLSQSPEYASQLKAMAGPRVIFVPFVSSKSLLLGLINQSSLLAFPSLSEGMSMTLLEAASVGAPVVCSDIPANRAVLAEHAVYFRSGDAGDLAEKLAWALEHPGEMTLRGQQAREWVRQRFSWDAIAEEYERLYMQVAQHG